MFFLNNNKLKIRNELAENQKTFVRVKAAE